MTARESIVESIIESFDFSKSDAEKIITVYLGLEVLKFDPVTGQSKLDGGYLWDECVMNNALEEYHNNIDKYSDYIGIA